MTKSEVKLPTLPVRSEDGNKGTFGRLLVVAGSEGMVGAPVMAGTAALRMGVGIVQIAVPVSILGTALSITPELIGLALGSASSQKFAKACEKSNAIVLGPGLGQSEGAKNRVLRVVRLNKPMVVDADALNILSQQKCWPVFFNAQAVLTPHPGEMARLIHLIGQAEVPSDDEGRVRIAVSTAKVFKQVLVLKGNRTVVTDGSRTYVNVTGNSTLAKAGTGDVLSGMIGALLAQQMKPFEAAVLSVYLHGRAGELAGQMIGKRSVLAREVVSYISKALCEHETKNAGTSLATGDAASDKKKRDKISDAKEVADWENEGGEVPQNV
jgi:ADP-dependent NAD(P)H-hydrate dehydratase